MIESLTRLRACIVKEGRALLRDRHAMAALFIMPTAFILVMSLALQDAFRADKAPRFDYVVVDHDGGAEARAFLDSFAAATHDRRIDGGLQELDQGRAKYALQISPQFSAAPAAQQARVVVIGAPDLPAASLGLIQARAADRLARSDLARWRALAPGGMPVLAENQVASRYRSEGPRRPTAVQQNVPAWLIFAMFFVVIPLSTIFIAEREHGTLQRLRTMHVSSALFFAGKLAPFFIINLLQAAAMLLVGRYAVPLLGGDALQLGASPAGLVAVLAAVSFAALGYALLVATLARTTEQATIVGGLGNVLLGAIGGIMVPKLVMPPNMQAFTVVSPMAWGQEGFMKLLLRDAGVVDVLPQIAALAAFGCACLVLAWLWFRRRGVT